MAELLKAAWLKPKKPNACGQTGKCVCVVILRPNFVMSRSSLATGGGGCCTFGREPRGAVGWASSQNLLQDDADAEDVSWEGAPPGPPGPPQQLRSRPQQVCNHSAGPHHVPSNHPSWAELGSISHMGCQRLPPSAAGGVGFLPIPSEGPQAQGGQRQVTDTKAGALESSPSPRLTSTRFKQRPQNQTPTVS